MKHRALEKILSTFTAIIIMVNVICILPYTRVIAAEKTADEIKSQITTTYSAIYNRYGKSFYGLCGTYVRYSLEELGLSANGELRGNGNQWYSNMQSLGTTSTGYTIKMYSGKNCINDIVAANSGNVYNIVVGFKYGTGSAGYTYGHVTFIHAIIDGIVYYSECFKYGSILEGGVHARSVSSFYSAYSDYTFDGAGHFVNPNEVKKPTKSTISIPKTEYSLGETITFTFSSDTATYYTIGIDNTAGRYKTEGMSSTSYSISSLPSGSYSAYVTASNSAGWCDSSRVNFTVGITATLNANGGSCSTASKRVVNGLTYGTLPDASKTGYSFAGWYTAQTGGTQVLSSTKVTATANHTLYAHWTANPVTVTLNANGGSVGTTSKTVTYNSTYGTLPDPTRTGYTFAGWYTAKDGGTKVTSSTTVSNASAHTLYAHWTANPYTLAYNANDGIGSMSNQNMKYDQAANLTANTFIRTGYTFAGWNTKADGSGTSYADKASVKNLAASGTITLYAKWTANKYTVKFDGNGADELSPASKEVTYNSTYGELPQPKRDGYNFIGWYTKAEGGNAITPDAKVTITGTQTLYAQWSQVKFLITFNATGGTSESAQKLVTYDKAYGVLPTAERTGYAFKGWYLDEACTQQITSDTIVALTMNQSVYAKWEIIKYVITFDANGGVAERNSKQVTYGKTYGVLPTASKDGDEFIGWFTKDGMEITSASIVEIESDTTLYAKWASEEVIGDVNADGVFNVADVVMLQKWLLCAGELTDWQAGDLCEDGRIDVFDLCLMKRMLLEVTG